MRAFVSNVDSQPPICLGSVLDPHPGAAVIGGNVLTSQRIVDVIFKAFSTCAASQVCLGRLQEANLLNLDPSIAVIIEI